MIITELITKYEADYKHTYSDQGRLIYCPDDTVGEEKILFEDAYDPVDSNREYLEYEGDAEPEEITAEEALEIIAGGMS